MERNIYVWIKLPNDSNGTYEDVPAGLLKLSIGDGRVNSSSFRYGQRYLERSNCIAVDAAALPLKDKEFFVDSTKFDIFTGIKDSCPDSWGRAVMEKRAGRTLREDEILMASSDFRVGALSFSESLKKPSRITPWSKSDEDDRALDLHRVVKAYGDFSSDEIELIEKSMKTFIMPGSTMGGARPKANCLWRDHLWVAKFQRANDSFDLVSIEYATMKLAKQCNINLPEIDLQTIEGKSVFLIKRFDRDLKSKKRLHFNSALSVLEETEMSFMHSSYMEIAAAIIKHSKYVSEGLRELYKRMIFNAFVNNNDDHLRNHGFLYNPASSTFELSPAYDIVPMNDSGEYERRLSIKCAVEENGEWTRNITRKGLIRAGEFFRLSSDDAVHIYNEIKGIVASRWKICFEEAGLKAKEIAIFETAFLKGDL